MSNTTDNITIIDELGTGDFALVYVKEISGWWLKSDLDALREKLRRK